MKIRTSFGPPQPVSRASSLGASAHKPTLHRESSESLGGRLRRPGCDGCGHCRCVEAPQETGTPARGYGLGVWLADRPWVFVLGAFALLIGVWTTFLTLALRNPVRDVLKNPLPTTADVRTGH